MPDPFDLRPIRSIHLNLDGAWPAGLGGLHVHDATEWGPKLRFCAPGSVIDAFFAAIDAQLAPFILYGSGDFHHLTALWLRRVREEFVVVSFDNHPDWDIRPPRWSCGGWVNRALELPHVQSVNVWGCGNFECWWPTQVFGNRRAERDGTLAVHPWADDRRPKDQARRGAIFRSTWREEFEQFVSDLRGRNVYVTVDMDCLQPTEATTNWENGRFTVDDVCWAIGRLRCEAHVVAGDICGAFSEQKYARLGQRFVAKLDHPKLPSRDEAQAQEVNCRTFEKLWPVLTANEITARPRS